MSLINRMLRDLSARQPGPRDVMNGIQVPQAEATRGSALQRLGLLAVLVAVFTGGLWLVFGPKTIAVPQPRGMTAAATPPAEAPAPPPPTIPLAPALDDAPAPAGAASQAPPAPPAKLQMDTQLSERGNAAKPPSRSARTSAQRASPASGSAGTAAKTADMPPAQDADELYAKARRALERGDDSAAEPLLTQALVVNPGLHAAREDLGYLHIRQGRFDEAQNDARAGLDLDPGRVGYRRLAGRLELARDRPADAAAVLERDPPPLERDVEYHGLLASAYQRLGRHEVASRLYRELVRVQPQEANWWAGYAMSRDALGDVAGALAAYSQARQLGGLAPNVLDHINRRTATLQAQS